MSHTWYMQLTANTSAGCGGWGAEVSHVDAFNL